MPELVLAGGVALVTSQRNDTPVVSANIASEMPVALPPIPDTVMVPVRPGGVPETVSCAVDICHRPSYVVLAVSSPIRCCTSLTTQLPPVPVTCTQPDSEVMAEPARAFASARRASFVYPRYSGSATAERIPTIRMTMRSSTSVKPASRSLPQNVLRIPFTVPMRDPLEATRPCTACRIHAKSSHSVDPEYDAHRHDNRGNGAIPCPAPPDARTLKKSYSPMCWAAPPRPGHRLPPTFFCRRLDFQGPRRETRIGDPGERDI